MRACVFILSFSRVRAWSARAHFLCAVPPFGFVILKISTSQVPSLSLTLLDARMAVFYSSSLNKSSSSSSSSSSSASGSKPSHCKGSGQPLLLANSKQSSWPYLFA